LIAVVLALGGSSALLAGCASQPEPPQSMRDPQANFSAYETFGWTSGAPEGADAPLKLLDNNLRTAIAAELQRRGYVEAPAGATPDLKITYDAASSDKIKNNPVRVGIGVGGWGGGNVGGSVGVSSPSVQSYKEGTLVVHAVDTARNAEVWQGRVSGKLTQGSLEPEAINRAVAAAMQDFPARSAGQ
jgi:hypothetical protein